MTQPEIYTLVESDHHGLWQLAKAVRKNSFLLNDQRSKDDPLPNTHILGLSHTTYMLNLRADGVIAAAATLYRRNKGESVRYPAEAVISLAQISTRPEFRHQGHARQLLSAIFRMASQERKVLSLTWFDTDGIKYLRGAVADIHASQPDVRVLYYSAASPIDAHIPYRLVEGMGDVRPKFEPRCPR